jgi:hypothetical protein
VVDSLKFLKNGNLELVKDEKNQFSPVIESSLCRLSKNIDSDVDDIDAKIGSRLEQRLLEEGLFATEKRAVTSGKSSVRSDGNESLRSWSKFFNFNIQLNIPAVAFSSLLVVTAAVVFYQQREKTLQIESELRATKSLLERQESDSAVYARSDLVTNAKLYTDQADILIRQVTNLASRLGMKVEVVVGGASEAPNVDAVPLREGQRLIVLGPFIAKDPKQKELKALLELPEDTDGIVNVVLVEF